MMEVVMSVLHLILIFHQKKSEKYGKEWNRKEQYGMIYLKENTIENIKHRYIEHQELSVMHSPHTVHYLYPFLSGALLGVLQMGVWLVWDPWWSLALGGAAVGFLTDWFALKVDAFFPSPIAPSLPLFFILSSLTPSSS
jgi:hypothetical protein